MIDEKQNQEAKQEYLVDAIENITYSPSLGSRTYWTIVFSNCAIYFCKTGTNSMPMFGPLGLFIHIYNKTKSNKDLTEILNKSKKCYQFTKDSLINLKIEKKLFGGRVIFPIGDKKDKKLKLSNKKYKKYINNLEIINNL